MIVIDLLMELPFNVVHSVLSQWGTLQAVCRLDAAVCTTAQRPVFLKQLQSLEVDADFRDAVFTYKLRWMKERKVKCSIFSFNSVEMQSSEDTQVLREYLCSVSSAIRSVTILNNSNEVTSVLLGLLGDLRLGALTKFFVAGHWNITAKEVKEERWEAVIQSIVTHSANTLVEFAVLLPVKWSLLLAKGIKMPTLRTLNMHKCSDADLLIACSAAPHLTEIRLEEARCTDAGFITIGQDCANLECLILIITDKIKNVDKGLVAVAKRCAKLKHLDLNICQNVTDIGLTAIATHCTQLQEVLIYDNNRITDASLVTLTQSGGANSLHKLCLRFCAGVQGTGILEVAKNCPFLHKLELNVVSTLTPANLEELIPHLKNVSHFNLKHHDAGKQALGLIAAHMRSLQHLTVAIRGLGAPAGLSDIVRLCEKLQTLHMGDEEKKLTGAIKGSMNMVEEWKALRKGLDVGTARSF